MDWSRLPPDVLRKIAFSLSGENVSIEDKLKHSREVETMCNVNRFLHQLCTIDDLNRNIWSILYKRDISNTLPSTNPNKIKKKYMRVLSKYLMEIDLDDIIINGYEKLFIIELGNFINKFGNLDKTEYIHLYNLAKEYKRKEIVDYLAR